MQGEQKILTDKNQELSNQLIELRGRTQNYDTDSTMNNAQILTKLNDLEHEGKLLQLRLYGAPVKTDENLQAVVTKRKKKRKDW